MTTTKQNLFKKVLNTRDYVQDGLVAMWDGIENAGFGKHNANATVWKDLVGNHDLAVGSTVGSNFMHFTGTQLNEYANAIVSTDNFTIEACIDNTGTTGNACIIGFGFSTSRLITMNQSGFGFRFGSGYFNYAATPNAKHSISYQTVFGSAYFQIDNKQIVSGNVESPNKIVGYCNLNVNGENPYGNYRNQFYAHNIRIYEGALGADAIAANYEIDKLRFGI